MAYFYLEPLTTLLVCLILLFFQRKLNCKNIEMTAYITTLFNWVSGLVIENCSKANPENTMKIIRVYNNI